jgi:hypothetical protein
MNTRVAKGPAGKAKKTARKETAAMRRRFEAIGKALDKGVRDLLAWIKGSVPAVQSAFGRIGRSTKKTAIRIEEEFKDEAEAVRKRLAGKEAAPVRKPAAKKAVKKPAAAKKAIARKQAPARRKPAAKKAAPRRTTARKKAAPKRKTAGAA